MNLAFRILAIAADGRERTVTDFVVRLPDVSEADVRRAISTLLPTRNRPGKLVATSIRDGKNLCSVYRIAGTAQSGVTRRLTAIPPANNGRGQRGVKGHPSASAEKAPQ